MTPTGNFRRRLLLSSVLCVGLTAAARLDAALVRYDFEKLTRTSFCIIRGKVVGMNSYWGKIGKLGPVILTDITIEVEETLKGAVEGKEITIQCLGGRIGERWQWCAESPQYEVGEQVLVFARKWRGRLWTTGWLQGKYRLGKNRAGSRVLVARKGLPLASGTTLSEVRDRVRRMAVRAATNSVPAQGDVRGRVEPTGGKSAETERTPEGGAR